MSGFVVGQECQKGARRAMGFHRNRAPKPRGIPFETLTQATIKFRIARLPNPITNVNATEVNRPPTKRKQSSRAPASDSGFTGLNMIDSASLLFLLWTAGIEYDPVACLQRAFQIDEHTFLCHLDDLAQVHTTFFPKPRMDKSLVINSPEPTAVQAPGKRHLHFILSTGLRPDRVCCAFRDR